MKFPQIGRRALIAALPGSFILANTAFARDRRHIYVVEDFGARGDGRTDDTQAIQRAIDSCARQGGGTVQLSPGGRYLSSTIVLKDHVTFDLVEGATLIASNVRESYRDKGCLIFAERAENIAITGRGTIEGQGSSPSWFPTLVEGAYTVPAPFLGYWNPLEAFPGTYYATGRPRMIMLVGCRRIRLSDFRIHDAPTWTIHPIGCEDLLIDAITIENNLLVPNCDGIDIDRCRNVRIVNCAVRAGDDCLVVKISRNFAPFGDCEDIVISDCTLESSSAGIKIEPEGPGTIRNVVITGCTISRSNRGISVLQRDGATIENVAISNLTITTQRHHAMWWGAAEAVHISNLPRRKSMAPGKISNIRLENLICQGEGGLFVRGWPDYETANISFSNIQMTLEKTTPYPADTYDIRPTELSDGLYKAQVAAIYARDLKNLTLRDIDIQWKRVPITYFGAAVRAEYIAGLTLDGIIGSAAHEGLQAIQLVETSPRHEA